MKKISFLAVLLLLFSSNARADGVVASPYIGVDLSLSKYNFANHNGINYSSAMPSSYKSLGFLFGLDLHEFFGLEFGYSSSGNESRSLGGQNGIDSLQSKITMMRYDLILKLRPQGQDFTIVGILGLLQGIASVNITGNSIDGRFKQGGYSSGYEYGFGLWKDFDSRFFGKAEYRKQEIDFGGIASGGKVYTLGIGFRF